MKLWSGCECAVFGADGERRNNGCCDTDDLIDAAVVTPCAGTVGTAARDPHGAGGVNGDAVREGCAGDVAGGRRNGCAAGVEGGDGAIAVCDPGGAGTVECDGVRRREATAGEGRARDIAVHLRKRVRGFVDGPGAVGAIDSDGDGIDHRCALVAVASGVAVGIKLDDSVGGWADGPGVAAHIDGNRGRIGLEGRGVTGSAGLIARAGKERETGTEGIGDPGAVVGIERDAVGSAERAAGKVLRGDGVATARREHGDAAGVGCAGALAAAVGEPDVATGVYGDGGGSIEAAGGIAACAGEKLGEFAWNLGMAFQLIDDMLDFVSRESTPGKSAGGDLKDGKVTLPLVYALEQASVSEINLVISVLRDRSYDAVPFADVLALVDRHGGMERTRTRAGQFTDRARQIVAEFPDSLCRRALFTLTDLVTERDC